MPKIELPFSEEEYAARLHRVRQSMTAADVEVLITCDPSNMAWLTGYDGWSFYVHQAVVVTLDHPPLWWGRRMDSFGAQRTVYMDADDIVSYCDDYVMSKERHAMEHLAEVLHARGLHQTRIGLELENYYFSAAAYLCLKRTLPHAVFADATALVNWQRAVKSAQELMYMGRAACIVERMHTMIAQTIEPGMRKNDLVADIFHTAIEGTEEFGGDYAAIVPLLPSGKDACAAHLTWDDKPFERDTCTFFELAGCYRRYHAPLCRTVYLGTPPQALIDAHHAVLDGLQAGIDAARPGNIAGDVARAFHGVLAKAGIHREGRCGYPIGLSYPPDWGERTISFRESDTTVLKPNMTFHFMPGLWCDDWGLEITESIVIAESGPAKPLAHYPRQLTVKP